MHRLLLLGVGILVSALVASTAAVPTSQTAGETSPPTRLAAAAPAPLFLPLEVEAALEPIRADVWQAAGFTGFKRSVAIIDQGFAGYADALGTSLPETVVTRSFRADGNLEAGTSHGLQAAEIVHAVAPNARIYLVNFSTELELSAAVDFLITESVDVISFSLGFIHAGPGDGTGLVDSIVQRAVNAGIAWSVASGNWAEQHWGGVFTDSDGDSIHEFAPDEQLNGRPYLAGDLVIASLRWQDTWGAACSDYDLEVFGPGGALVAASRDIQNCSGDPVESVQVLATSGGTYSARIVQAEAESPAELSLLLLGSPDRGDALDIPVPTGSLAQPADHPGVLTVGARVNGGSEAPYSSRGPTTDGRPKPELLAPTGLINSAGEAFSGTSAAAPHAAGLLALLGEALPDLDGPDLIDELRTRSDPVPGTDRRSANLGSLVGLGDLLPVGGDEAILAGAIPPDGGITILQYRGPDGYPLRFAHLLTDLIEADAFYRLDTEAQRWEAHIRGAPAFVQDFDRVNDDDLVVLVFSESE